MKSKFYPVFALLIIALLLSACGGAKAANQLEAIKQNGKIVIGTSADYPPFEFVDANGNFDGFDVALMNKLGEELGVTVEIQDMPFDSLIAAVQEGKIDIAIAAFNYSEERDKTVDFSDPYYYAEDGFVALEGFSGAFDKPEDAANYKLGVQTGSTADGWVTENLLDTGLISEDNLFRYERIDQAGLDVKSGRIDLLMTDYVPALALAENIGGLEVIYHAELSTGPVNIILPEGSKELQSALNDAIKKLLENGFIDEIATKYIGN
jgi:polar amino acid transport system substrate-binding protein